MPLSALGLDSLQAAELRQAIEIELGVSLPIASLIEGPSPAALAAEIAGFSAPVEISPGPAPTEFPLSQGQRALWFLDRLDRDAFRWAPWRR